MSRDLIYVMPKVTPQSSVKILLRSANYLLTVVHSYAIL
jgi:hypothetical protein